MIVTQEDTEAEARVRVERGVRWLNENFPGWLKRIKANSLDLAQGEHCICGQVFKKDAEKTYHSGGYNYAVNNLFTEANSWLTPLAGSTKIWTKTTLNYLKAERARRVACNLGFLEGSTRFGNCGSTIYVGYDELQSVWLIIIKELRAAERAATKQAIRDTIQEVLS